MLSVVKEFEDSLHPTGQWEWVAEWKTTDVTETEFSGKLHKKTGNRIKYRPEKLYTIVKSPQAKEKLILHYVLKRNNKNKTNVGVIH